MFQKIAAFFSRGDSLAQAEFVRLRSLVAEANHFARVEEQNLRAYLLRLEARIANLELAAIRSLRAGSSRAPAKKAARKK